MVGYMYNMATQFVLALAVHNSLALSPAAGAPLCLSLSRRLSLSLPD